MSSRKPPALSSTMVHGDVVNIRDATLNMPIHQVNEFANRDRALDLLRSNSSLSALLNARQRYDPPRCTEATRRHIMQKLEDWVHQDDPHSPLSSIFWLFGGAGAGKSALAQTLAEKFKTNEDLAASFFFFKADVNRNNGNRLIPTLALQLVQSFQGLTPIMEETILQNIMMDLFKSSRQTQMLELLVAPLIRLSLAETDDEPMHPNTSLKSHPRLVVIDGLDECIDSIIQCDLLRIIANAIPHFPYPLRFLVTSRPESHITRAFQHDVGEVAQYDLSVDPDADKDIQTFLDDEFAKIRRTHPLRHHLPYHWPHPADIIPIVERSSAHFIYASTAIRFIQSPKHRPDDRLKVILGLKQPYKKERPYAPLDALYKLIFLEIQDSSQLRKIQRALGIVYLRTMKVGLFAWAQWTSDCHVIDVLLKLRPGDILLLFDPLLSLLTFHQENIRIFHKSLFDYLFDPIRSGNLQLDLGLVHETAANYIVQVKRLKDRWYSTEFEDFTFHCQFARLNGKWTDRVRSLASHPKITVRSSKVFEPSRSSLLQSMLNFLQVIGRREFDPSGHFYKEYVRKKNQHLRPPVSPLRQRMIFWLVHPGLVLQLIALERNIRLELRKFPVDLKDLELTEFNGRVIPAVNTSTIKCIEKEHEMFSSYVETHHRFPNVVVSFLEKSSGLIHSCHFVLKDVSDSSVSFMMLVTYTEDGVRLSCAEFEGLLSLRFIQESRVSSLVGDYLQDTQENINNNYTRLFRKMY